MSTAPRGVIFDLFGTLVPNYTEQHFGAVMAEMSQLLGLSVSELRGHWVAESWVARATGTHADAGDCAAWVLAQSGRSAEPAVLDRVRAAYLSHSSAGLVPLPGVVEVLRRLRQEGRRTGLLSDCSSETVTNWKHTPFIELIDSPIFSCAEGMKKPNPLLFARALEAIGLSGEDCVYVGDGGGRELQVAEELGMRVVKIAWKNEDSDSIPVPRDPWDGAVIHRMEELHAFLGSS